MTAEERKTLAGRIVLVQEDRFRLVGDTGRGYLLTLSHASPVSIEDLQRWQRADTRLIVEYTGRPGMADGIAHRFEHDARRFSRV